LQHGCRGRKTQEHSILSDYLALRPVEFGILFRWIGVTLCWAAASDLVSILVGRPVVPEFTVSAYATSKPVWIFWVATVIVAPLFEEAFFRGFLLKGFASSLLRPIGAVLVTAALWAAIHVQYELPEIASIFILGLLFGAARLRTGSLVVPVVMHATSNLWSTVEAAIL
jgi:membrane protease YdiL (CAAX protease family)